MSRKREAKALEQLQGILHLSGLAKKKTVQADLLDSIHKLAIDARDIIAIKDPDEQRFWNACIAFSLSATVIVRKVAGHEMRTVSQLDPVGYHWSLSEILRLLPHMITLPGEIKPQK